MLLVRLSGHSLGGLVLYSLRIPEGKLQPEAPKTGVGTAASLGFRVE